MSLPVATEGSGVFYDLLNLEIVPEPAFDLPGHRTYESTQPMREVLRSDRWDGTMSLAGNTLTIRGRIRGNAGGPMPVKLLRVRRPS